MADEPFAILITWTCYANWLPGDARGYVSNTIHPGGGFQRKQNTPHTPYTRDDPFTRARAKRLQRSPAALLTPALAQCVAKSLIDAAQNRGWHIVRAAIMANHVHVVISNCPHDGPGVRRILKGNSQAALTDFVGQTASWWTAGGSDRYKRGSAAVEAAIRYVANQKGILAEIIDMRLHLPNGDAAPPA
jgi:REP element-mobilizing transposase RayT